MAEIEKMKAQETHPMQAKKDLARRIVADFHSAEEATKAGEDWAKQFQKNEVPDTMWSRGTISRMWSEIGGGIVRVVGGPTARSETRQL